MPETILTSSNVCAFDFKQQILARRNVIVNILSAIFILSYVNKGKQKEEAI
jgi:hypothetical protein